MPPLSEGSGDPTFYPKQVQSLRESDCRVNVWHGSVRSGKTIASILRFLIAIANAGPTGEIVMTGRTRESIYRNVIAPMQDELVFGREVANQVKYTRGAPMAKILGRDVHLIGASDAKAENVVRGMTVLLWYADEVTVQPEALVTQMLGRMSPPKAQAFWTTNPEGPRHYIKAKFLDRVEKGELKNWAVWHFTLDDNLGLEPDYVESLKAEFTGLWYQRFVLGLWVAAEGAIYDGFDPAVHQLASLPCQCGLTEAAHWAGQHPYAPLRIDHAVVGVDYGTANAFAAELVGLAEDGNLYVLDEWRHDSKAGEARWTDAQLSEGLQAFINKQPGEWTPDWVCVDPSAASFHTQLQYDGVKRVTPADNRVIDGIRTVASMLALRALFVCDPAAGLLDEIPGYVWDSKEQEKGNDVPVKLKDHSLDALRYAVMCALSYWGNRINRGVAA